MALILRVDGDRWRSHLKDVHERHPNLVPVAKGNGYGLGLGRLARKSQWLGVDTIAIGTYEEVPHVEQRYDGSLLVLTPWRPRVGWIGRATDRRPHEIVAGRQPRQRELAAAADRVRRGGLVVANRADHGPVGERAGGIEHGSRH